MPRILTNNSDLPAPLYAAIKNDTYVSRGYISATSVIDSPYIRILKKHNVYYEDAADMYYALTGSAVHSVIERAGERLDNSMFVNEEHLLLPLSIDGRIIDLSGTPDLLEFNTAFSKELELELEDEFKDVGPAQNGGVILHDYKNVSVYTVNLGETSSTYKKWIEQTNIYARMLLKLRNIKVDCIKLHAFMRDHKKSEAKYKIGYPERPIQTFFLPIMKEEEVDELILRRLRLHIEADRLYEEGNVDLIPICDKEERWSRPEIWKVIKEGGKRATRSFAIYSEKDKQEATVYYANAVAKNSKMELVKTPGVDIRCTEYCPVNKFCRYYKERYGNNQDERRDTEGETGQELPLHSNQPELPVFDF